MNRNPVSMQDIMETNKPQTQPIMQETEELCRRVNKDEKRQKILNGYKDKKNSEQRQELINRGRLRID